MLIKKLICRLFGHRMAPVSDTSSAALFPSGPSRVFVHHGRCKRCGRWSFSYSYTIPTEQPAARAAKA